MRLDALCGTWGRIEGDGEVQVTHLTSNSKEVVAGSLFVAIAGSQVDGHAFIAQAKAGGAVAVMTAHPERVTDALPLLVVSDVRAAMADVARMFHGYPDQALAVIGITGTNGKTTATFMLQQLLAPQGRCGRIGTFSNDNGLQDTPAVRTTPESSMLFRLLSEMRTNGCRYAALELSSHGLMQDRVRGLGLRYALFTNLSQDHLDYHGNMEAYFQAKARMFSMLTEGGVAVVNGDDPWGRRLRVPDGCRLRYYGTTQDCDLQFQVLSLSMKGAEFVLRYQGKQQSMNMPFIGRHNVYNFAACAAVALEEGVGLAELAQLAPQLGPVPGRMELIDCGQAFGVAVDYAHTPDALDKVLKAGRELTDGRLIAVFGAGGDRDQAKRRPMGAAADAHAHILVLTSDNPRNEDPQQIMAMVAQGIARREGQDFYSIVDRKAAIAKALTLAEEGDLVIVAGKGHETTQVIKGVAYPFDDRKVVRELLESLGG